MEHAPQSIEGRAVAEAIRRPGVWTFNAWSGAIVGLNMTEAMASLPQGADADVARRLFAAAEMAFVKAAIEHSEKVGKD